MAVSVIIVNYNSGKLLKKCFQHLMAQTVKPDRIWVIDNASTDGSADTLEASDRLTVKKMATNAGFAAGNNWAIRACVDELVVLLNPDAFPEPDWLERLLAAAHEYPEISMFGSRLVAAENPEKLDGDGDCYHVSGMVWRMGHGYEFRQQQEPYEVFSPCAAAALYRIEALRKADGFDEDFFCYMEDVDLAFRLRLLGHRCLQVPDSVVRHMGSATTGGQHSDFAVYHGHRNLVWTFVKNMPGALFWAFLPLHFMVNLAAVIWYSGKGQARVILKAKKDAFFGLARMWHKRHDLQKKKSVSQGKIIRILDRSLIPRPKGSASK